jgi:hypothetical protein
MAISPLQTNNPFLALTRLFAETADTNRDGQVSQDEFATFLSNLLQSLTPRSPVSSLAPNSAPHATILPASGSALPLADPAHLPHLSGYSQTKLADSSHTTPKYLFGRVAQNVDLSSVVDKESAEALLRLMQPELEAAGLTILDISKDKIQVNDDNGNPVWVDVIRGSESGSPAFQWLPVLS